jgi:tetratricopeptide (TPR) repeat protein/transcriptional regulator with XRE-family HTH domain
MENRQSLPESFGELLKSFRKRQHLTQTQLARQLGVHMNTVSSWEVGTYLPATRGLVLELARHLALSESETRQFLEASLTGFSPHWLVPLKRNSLFTGREQILEALHTRLGVNQMVALTQPSALHGLSGVGKTQIALEYAYRYALEYSAIFWIGAETAESIVSSLLHIAELLQLPERDDEDHRRAVVAVQHWLSTHDQWLLIWDNVEDLALLDHFLPSTRQGAIVITTRCQALGTLAQGIDLEPMGQEEGILFVLRRAKVLKQEATYEDMQRFAVSKPGEYAAAAELVTDLAALPLALDQAGAYIDETGCSLAGYLHRYQQRHTSLLARRGGPGSDHPQSVTTTFRFSMERVEQEMRAAADILRVCALLHAEAIPEELFLEGAAHLGPDLESLVADPSQFDQALAILRSLSLVRRHPETGTLSLHRLVQVVLQEGMSEQERTMWQRRVIRALSALFPEVISEGTAATWKQCERLLAHVLTAVTTITDEEEDQELVRVLGKAADYLRERVQYERAEALYKRSLNLGEQVLGPMHPEMAYPLTGLANLYQEQGRFEQAEPLYQRALSIWEQAFGSEHPLVAHPLTGLAILYQKQGSSEQAEPLFQRALSIWKQALGPMHPLVTRPLNGLAILYKRQGKPEQAELLYERALSIQTQALGPEHPQIARLLYNLALLYEEQGKYEQAEPLFRQSLRLGEQVWGPEHPNLAHPFNGLAILYQEQGKDAQAESLSQRALHLWEQALGAEHLLVAYPLYNLAILSQRQGKYEQAEHLLQQSLHIAEQALGPEHPQVAYPLNGLAELYAEQGKDDQAEQLYTRALQIREQTLGREHPDLAFSLNGLANLYASQGKQKQAEPLYERAFFIREQQLSQYHPETAQTLHDLASFRKTQGHLSEALSFAERALSIRSRSLGDTHPKTIASRTLYTQLGQEREWKTQEKPPEEREEEITDRIGEEQERKLERAPILFQKTANPSPSNEDPLQEFLDACCERHPRAWCRSADLWQTYEHWVEERQERFPLPRGAFIAQLKAHGCRTDRTKTARIWRGIALVKKER